MLANIYPMRIRAKLISTACEAIALFVDPVRPTRRCLRIRGLYVEEHGGRNVRVFQPLAKLGPLRALTASI